MSGNDQYYPRKSNTTTSIESITDPFQKLHPSKVKQHQMVIESRTLSIVDV